MEFEMLEHRLANKEILIEIARLKGTAWSYDLESQLKWMSEYLSADDFHILLRHENEMVGYLTMHNVRVCVNNQILHAIGVGNVVAKLKGQGIGQKLMEYATNYINSVGLPAVLFCRPQLVPFYEACLWTRIRAEVLIIDDQENKVIDTPVFLTNFNKKVKQFVYKGRLF